MKTKICSLEFDLLLLSAQAVKSSRKRTDCPRSLQFQKGHQSILRSMSVTGDLTCRLELAKHAVLWLVSLNTKKTLQKRRLERNPLKVKLKKKFQPSKGLTTTNQDLLHPLQLTYEIYVQVSRLSWLVGDLQSLFGVSLGY